MCQEGEGGQHFRASTAVCGHMIMRVSVECSELLSREGTLRVGWLTWASRALPAGSDSGRLSAQGSIYGTGEGVTGEGKKV